MGHRFSTVPLDAQSILADDLGYTLLAFWQPLGELLLQKIIIRSLALNGKCDEWQLLVKSFCSCCSSFLLLPPNLNEAEVVPNVISHGAVIGACEKSGQWQLALKMLLVPFDRNPATFWYIGFMDD